MSYLIKVTDINVSYPPPTRGLLGLFSKAPPLPLALENINFELEKGERLALIGLNGSGKSTLLRTIAGIYEPQSGQIEVNGSIVALFNLGVGMRMDLSGRKNIVLQGMANGQSYSEITSLIPDIINFSELDAVIDNPIHTYSQGMAMRLSFAVATALKPEILLLDEWIGAGDRIFRAKAQERLEGMVKDSSAFILASHNTNIIRRYCTKAILLDKGHISEHGDVEKVLNAFVNSTD